MPDNSDRDPVVAIREAFAAYAAKMGPAVQGQGGDSHTYRVCAVGVCDFDLSEADVLAALGPWNATCLPPWDERDLLVKIRNAAKYARGERGSKIRAGSAARAGAFATDEEALDALVRCILDPLDPERAARDLAALGIRVEPDVAREERGQRQALAWLLSEVVSLLPWKRAPRKGKPDPGKVPPKDRPAAVLVAVGALLSVECVEEGPDRITWVMEQAAREYWACHERPRADRDTVVFDHRTIDRMASPTARDGHARARPALAGANEHERALRAAHSVHCSESNKNDAVTAWPSAGGVRPEWESPEDPETICASEEAFEKFESTLSPLQRKVLREYDETYGGGMQDVARRIGTTCKAAKNARHRINEKLGAWLARQAAEANGGTITPRRATTARRKKRSTNMRKPWGIDNDLLAMIRPMRPDEAADMRAGYPASRYRRRAAVWGRPEERERDDRNAAPAVGEAA